jgi:hypothetical protein
MGAALIAAGWTSAASGFAVGQFTRAEATADWSHGSFAGSVIWSDCTEFCVSYNVYVFDEPSVNSCDQNDWERAGSDPNVRQLWESGPRNVNETIPFEGSNVELIPGVYGQRLCLIGVQTEENSGVTTVHPQLINQTLFQVTPPPPTPPVVNTTTITTTTPTSTVSEACKRARARVKRLRNLRRRAQNHHKPKQARKLNLAIKRAQKAREAAC